MKTYTVIYDLPELLLPITKPG